MDKDLRPEISISSVVEYINLCLYGCGIPRITCIVLGYRKCFFKFIRIRLVILLSWRNARKFQFSSDPFDQQCHFNLCHTLYNYFWRLKLELGLHRLRKHARDWTSVPSAADQRISERQFLPDARSRSRHFWWPSRCSRRDWRRRNIQIRRSDQSQLSRSQ